MEITFTELAKHQLKNVSTPNQILKLMYDTEGCGCVVNGVPTLRVVQEAEGEDIELKTNFVPVWIERTKQVFFEDKMTIDFLTTYNCYQLRSPNQMLNPRMKLLMK
jgi:iron-sulfur cluster insertion protein